MAIKHAFIKQLQGITFAGKTDANHWIAMDGPETVANVPGSPAVTPRRV